MAVNSSQWQRAVLPVLIPGSKHSQYFRCHSDSEYTRVLLLSDHYVFDTAKNSDHSDVSWVLGDEGTRDEHSSHAIRSQYNNIS